jgi:SAM-dependent methyltransferase
VLAEDIMPQVRDQLSDRVQRQQLDNVAVKLGTPDNPMLPAQSFDRILLVHMYHEVQSPYAFLWHLRDGVKPEGLVVVVDADRPVSHHGIPPAQVKCEFAALGMEPVKFRMLTGGEVYFMAFRVARPKPAPEQIQPCKG